MSTLPNLSRLSTGTTGDACFSGKEAKDASFGCGLYFGVGNGDLEVDSLAVIGFLAIDMQSQFELSAVSLSALVGVVDCLVFASDSNVVIKGFDMFVF